MARSEWRKATGEKRLAQTTGSNDRLKRPAQMTGSNDLLKRPAQTTGSNDRLKRPAQTTGSNDRLKRLAQTTGENDRRKRPAKTTGEKRPAQTLLAQTTGSNAPRSNDRLKRSSLASAFWRQSLANGAFELTAAPIVHTLRVAPAPLFTQSQSPG